MIYVLRSSACRDDYPELVEGNAQPMSNFMVTFRGTRDELRPLIMAVASHPGPGKFTMQDFVSTAGASRIVELEQENAKLKTLLRKFVPTI